MNDDEYHARPLLDLYVLDKALWEVERRVAALEARRHRGAPSLIEHLRHIYESLPDNGALMLAPAELQRLNVRISNAKRELHGVLISLGVPPEELV